MGDSFTFEFAVDLAHVEDPATLKVEVFGLEKSQGEMMNIAAKNAILTLRTSTNL